MAGEDVVVASESGEMIVDAKAEVEEVREEGEDEGAEGEGLGNGFPIARVKRIMRKNPDKKKQFSQDTVRAVCIATVSSSRLLLPFRPPISAIPKPAGALTAARCTVQELFLDDIVKNSHEHTVAKKRKTMQLGDIGTRACVHSWCRAAVPPTRARQTKAQDSVLLALPC
jgi:histone H3/H4